MQFCRIDKYRLFIYDCICKITQMQNLSGGRIMQNAYAVKIPVGRYPRTERVTKLRERALHAIDTHAMWYQRSETNADDRYGWDDRHAL